MSLIIQSGHRTSSSKILMQSLYKCGLTIPKKISASDASYENLSEIISKIILNKKSQVEPISKLVDSIIIDASIANFNCNEWGWESEHNLASLDYWEEYQPQTIFVLVYDHPFTLFKYILKNNLNSAESKLLFSDWIAYHKNMLNTIEGNENKKILLVEGISSLEKLPKFIEKLKIMNSSIKIEDSCSPKNGASSDNFILHSLQDKDIQLIYNFISNEILESYSEIITVYNKLNHKSSIKKSEPIVLSKKKTTDRMFEVLDSLVLIDSLRIKNEELRLQNEKVKNDFNTKKVELEDKILKLKNEKKNQINLYSNKGIESENDQLMQQLQVVQEKLESYYVENQKLNKKITSLQFDSVEAYKKEKAIKQSQLSKSPDIKKDLPYRLGNKIVKAKKPKEIAKLPVELIKEYRSFKEISIDNNKVIESSSSVNSHITGKEKNHLSYRFGVLLIEAFQSPTKTMVLPALFAEELYKFKKNKNRSETTK